MVFTVCGVPGPTSRARGHEKKKAGLRRRAPRDEVHPVAVAREPRRDGEAGGRRVAHLRRAAPTGPAGCTSILETLRQVNTHFAAFFRDLKALRSFLSELKQFVNTLDKKLTNIYQI